MTRLDAALAARGLARSRTHAASLIADGLVRVDGHTVIKPSTPVADGVDLAVDGGDHYVSRAAHKLIAGLDGFGIPVDGRLALDMGASTGGFTQVLRERGGRKRRRVGREREAVGRTAVGAAGVAAAGERDAGFGRAAAEGIAERRLVGPGGARRSGAP
ncbi:SAM-dependent methyltransferase, partial [Clavibacter michiganensis]|uniref:SAM-dependent methyltransferase n=1 Tax=Clavibacter michiganensis TaxID=28447 RepID=UPI00292F5CDC